MAAWRYAATLWRANAPDRTASTITLPARTTRHHAEGRESELFLWLQRCVAHQCALVGWTEARSSVLQQSISTMAVTLRITSQMSGYLTSRLAMIVVVLHPSLQSPSVCPNSRGSEGRSARWVTFVLKNVCVFKFCVNSPTFLCIILDHRLHVATYYLSLPRVINFKIPPATSPEIWHHAVWRTWLFGAYSNEIWLYYQYSLLLLLCISLWKVGRMSFLSLGVKGLIEPDLLPTWGNSRLITAECRVLIFLYVNHSMHFLTGELLLAIISLYWSHWLGQV